MRPLNRDTYPIGAEDYAPEILKAWLEAFPDSRPEARDKEDWIENAIFLEVFNRLGVDYEILEPAVSAMVSAANDGIQDNGGKTAFFHTGISPSDRIKGVDYALPMQNAHCTKTIMEHLTSETFQKNAGRSMILTTTNGAEISAAVRKIVPESGEIFLKTIEKEYACKFTIEAGRDPWQQICGQDGNLPWMILHYDGLETPYFSVQGVIAPTYEYRMFMVSDTPVTGAGCVEQYTPVDNELLFDPKMEMIRNESEIEADWDIVDSYIAFANQFGKDFAAEHGEGLAYSLDLCIDANNGKIVPIELNPPFNLGRYASRVDVWVKAVDIMISQKA